MSAILHCNPAVWLRARAQAKRERAKALRDAQPTLPSLPITRRRLNETPKKG